MNMVNIVIDNKKLSVPEGTTILEAAAKAGIKIPTLCNHTDQVVKANCRICLVEIKGGKKLEAACATKVWEGAEIVTNSKLARDARKTVLELILADHVQDCLNCIRNGSCELQKLSMEFVISEPSFDNIAKELPLDDSNPSIVRDPKKCIRCGRCIEVCQEIQTVGAINTSHRSDHYVISTAFDMPLDHSSCIYCGQCSLVCPVGAIYEKNDTERVWEAIDNPDIHVVVQTAPAVRVSLGEEFGLEPGSRVTGQMVAALRRLGFDKVFDTDFTADLTILEEGTELIGRITNNGVLPMITSCSPGWINFIEKSYPELLPHLSSCKSPQQMFGALAKTYYAQKTGIKPDKIFVVSIMPCTAKKYESTRSQMYSSGFRDVDAVLTTRELARMLKLAGINFNEIEPEEFDAPLGISTGAGVIFGASGGVMEAALRTVYEVLTKEELKNIDFVDVRGLTGIKEATVAINDMPVKVAVANGIKNARALLEKIKSGECDYTFIEIMCCPGGCIGGGGQPHTTTNKDRNSRITATYDEDKNMKIRKSHENPAVKELYNEFLKEPNSHIAHKLLHTTYKNRKTTR
ncbi:MAG: NADH-dependent [FeFe] hydrogenase, group A6 [Bacillota bacterium]